MASKIKDQATATEAALKLNTGVEVLEKPGEASAPKEKTTTEKLFPEFTTDDGGIINRPVRPFEDKSKPLPAVLTPTPDLQGQKPPTTTPTAPAYLTAAELAGKMVKLKVDGIEQDVPAESLIKTNQLERHLNAQLMKLAQERGDFERERSTLRQGPLDPKPAKTEPPVKRSAEVENLEAQIAQMQAQMQGLQQTLIPQIQEAGIQRVEKMVKERIGTDDFRAHFDQIRDRALTEGSRPEVAANPQARAYFDSDAFYFETYKELKLKELTSRPPSNPNSPALVTQQGAPVIVNNSGRPVSIPNIESSGGVPSRSDVNGNWASRAQNAFEHARQTGRTDDWVAYYQIKSESPA
jgi:hypothetical protein